MPAAAPADIATRHDTWNEAAARLTAVLHLAHAPIALTFRSDDELPTREPATIARYADLDVTMTLYAHTNLEAKREVVDSIEWEDL